MKPHSCSYARDHELQVTGLTLVWPRVSWGLGSLREWMPAQIAVETNKESVRVERNMGMPDFAVAISPAVAAAVTVGSRHNVLKI